MLPIRFEYEISETQLLAPLYFNAEDANTELTLSGTVNYLIKNGVPTEKIVLTVFTFGLVNKTSTEVSGLNAAIKLIELSTGSFPYICSEVKDSDLTVVHDKRVGTYAYHKRSFITYYDVEDAYSLGEYVALKNLGGGSVYLLDDEDIYNQCGCGQMPMLNGFIQGLRNIIIGKAENCT